MQGSKEQSARLGTRAGGWGGGCWGPTSARGRRGRKTCAAACWVRTPHLQLVQPIRDHQESPGPRRLTHPGPDFSPPTPGIPPEGTAPAAEAPAEPPSPPAPAGLRPGSRPCPTCCWKSLWVVPSSRVYPDSPHTPLRWVRGTFPRDLLPPEVAATPWSILSRPEAPSPAQGAPWGAQLCGHGASRTGICLLPAPSPAAVLPALLKLEEPGRRVQGSGEPGPGKAPQEPPARALVEAGSLLPPPEALGWGVLARPPLQHGQGQVQQQGAGGGGAGQPRDQAGSHPGICRRRGWGMGHGPTRTPHPAPEPRSDAWWGSWRTPGSQGSWQGGRSQPECGRLTREPGVGPGLCSAPQQQVRGPRSLPVNKSSLTHSPGLCPGPALGTAPCAGGPAWPPILTPGSPRHR